MVAALKAVRGSAIFLADLEAAMAAGIQMGADAAAAVARDEHRLLAHEGAKEGPRAGKLRLVAEQQPRTSEDALFFELVEGGVGENLRLDPRAVRGDVV